MFFLFKKVFMKNFILLFVFFLVGISCFSQSKRALFIAIDTYQPPAGMQATATNRPISTDWTNLEGCVNDAIEIKELVKVKYGFNDESKIKFIKNDEANRESIIRELNNLINVSQKGDIVFIYYAGHGSQVFNSLSKESDKQDETIVPSDSYKGVSDIRDKELATLFNKLLEKGVKLTVIFDSCHSGSIGRGGMDKTPPKKRTITGSLKDVKDGKVYPKPEEKGALILSAAQDEEPAEEQTDDKEVKHGAFTVALLKTLQTLPTTASVETLFKSIRSIMKYYGKVQEPVLAGTEARKSSTLFDEDRSTMKKNETTVTVTFPENKDSLIIQGGWAIGMRKGIELRKYTDSTVIIKIDKVETVTKSIAKIITGSFETIKPGDLFVVSNWVSDSKNVLKFYIQETEMSNEELVEFYKNVTTQISQNKNITIVTDPKERPTTHTLFYNSGWYIGYPDASVKIAGNNIDEVVKTLLQINTNASLLINLPLNSKTAKEIKKNWNDNNSVQIGKTVSNSTYLLNGRVTDNGLEYAFIIPKLNKTDSKYLSSLPVRTDYINANNSESLVDTLSELSYKLGKIQAWVSMTGPQSGQSNFPFVLGLKKVNKKNVTTTDLNVNTNDTLVFVLKKDKANFNNWNVEKRFIYVFSIDENGKTTLFYPASGSSVENKLPVIGMTVADETPLLTIITDELANISETFIMLSTDEPIIDPTILESDGVKTRSKHTDSWLGNLLETGSKSRGDFDTPLNWTINKISIRTVDKKQIKK